jgi:hypothetical protein
MACPFIAVRSDARPDKFDQLPKMCLCHVTKLRIPDKAIETTECQVRLMCNERPEVAEADVIAVAAIEDVLRRIMRVQGKSAAMVMRNADLLQAWKPSHGRPCVVLGWIEARQLKRRLARPTLTVLKKPDHEGKLMSGSDFTVTRPCKGHHPLKVGAVAI